MLNNRARWLILALVLSAPGCNREPPPPRPAVMEDTAAKRNLLWERRRQCAAQAATVAARPENTKASNGISMLSWTNHYNQERDRCFLRMDFINPHSKDDVAAGIPLMTYSVIDVFDAAPPSLLCTDQASAKEMFCPVTNDKGEDVFDCRLCRALSKELMSK